MSQGLLLLHTIDSPAKPVLSTSKCNEVAVQSVLLLLCGLLQCQLQALASAASAGLLRFGGRQRRHVDLQGVLWARGQHVGCYSFYSLSLQQPETGLSLCFGHPAASQPGSSFVTRYKKGHGRTVLSYQIRELNI